MQFGCPGETSMQFDIRCCQIPEGFWDRQRASVAAGTFWADEARSARDQPNERLYIAVENLPLPAAFREAAIAVRQIVRNRRKAGEPYEEELRFLYSLAAVENFVSATPYIEHLAETGWNAVEMMTREDWQSLTFEWSSLGCDELPLLTKTDRRQMIQHWGNPVRHPTLRTLHEDVWQKAVDALLARRDREHNTSWLSPRTPFTTQDYLDFVNKVQERVKQMREAEAKG